MDNIKKWRLYLCLPTLGLSFLGIFYLDYEYNYVEKLRNEEMRLDSLLVSSVIAIMQPYVAANASHD